MITGTKSPFYGVPSPGGCRYSLDAFWTDDCRSGTVGERLPVRDVATFRGAIEPYLAHHHMGLSLNRDDGEAGGLRMTATGDRAFVCHFDMAGGTDSYARATDDVAGLPEQIGFRIDNGQLDMFHRTWTVSRADGLQALEHFLLHGEPDPGLRWVIDPPSLNDPAPDPEPPR